MEGYVEFWPNLREVLVAWRQSGQSRVNIGKTDEQDGSDDASAERLSDCDFAIDFTFEITACAG